MNCKCAGIVLYNPDIDRLIENYKAISKQVDDVILVDNNSNNFNEIIFKFNNISNVTILRNEENKGIAAALNQICEEAKKLKYDWVYLLDQDSISSPTIINSYSRYVSNENLALTTPYIIDTNKTNFKEYQNLKLSGISVVNWAITAGSLVRLDVWEKIGQFDEELFIDTVDIDYSIRLKINGYQQYRVNSEYILQEVGKAEPTFLFRPHKDNAGKWTLKRYFRTNHSLIRQYYMVRNNIILVKKYKKYRSVVKGIIFLSFYIFSKIVFENNRGKLIKEIAKGIRDGIKYVV